MPKRDRDKGNKEEENNPNDQNDQNRNQKEKKKNVFQSILGWFSGKKKKSRSDGTPPSLTGIDTTDHPALLLICDQPQPPTVIYGESLQSETVPLQPTYGECFAVKDKMKRLQNVTSDRDEINKIEENYPGDKNEHNRNENGKGKKKKFGKFKRLKEIIGTKKKSHCNETPPLLTIDNSVVEGYDEHIEENKTYLKETKELMAMEREIYNGGSKDNHRRKEAESLYKDLEERVSRVVKDSISKKEGIQLKDAIEAILEQDRVRRPSQQSWKTKWIEWVASSVTERINRLPKFSRDHIKNDLIHVIKNLKPLYPKEFDVCNTYAQQYHRVLQDELNLVTDYELSEIHLLLTWVKILYPSILRDPALADHINVAQLGELLPPEKIRHLEKMYFHKLKGKLEEWMAKALEKEKQNWESESQPEMIGSSLQSDLSKDIITMVNSGIQSAVEISKDFVGKVTPILVNEFLDFLRRYKRLFKNYIKKAPKNNFRAIVIVNMNGCYNFRKFTGEKLRTDEDTKQEIYSILTKITDKGYGILLQDLFQKIEPDFRRISRKKGLNSQEIMSDIIRNAKSEISKVTALEAPCRQVMADKVHTHLVKNYLKEIMDIRQCNIKQQKTLAAEMDKTANDLAKFCTHHLKEAQGLQKATWRNDAIRRIAVVIRLEDVEAIKLEVGMLPQQYPDIRKEHVRTFLHIKQNLKSSVLKSIEDMLESSLNNGDDPERQLFTLIPFIPNYHLYFMKCYEKSKSISAGVTGLIRTVGCCCCCTDDD